MAPLLEVQEALVRLQCVLAGLLQLVVDDTLVVRGLPLWVPGGILVGGRVHGLA